MSAGWSRLDKWTRWWLMASVVFGVGLIGAAITGRAREVVIAFVAIPLVGVLAAIWSIVARLRHDDRSGVNNFTWLVVGVLAAFTLLGLISIGPIVAPAPACLLVATLRIQGTGRVKG
ncbi:MAG: hypothetical protein ACYC1I_05580 [Acidimicrobiales bacterium]